MQLWEDILARIEKKVSYQNFDIWFRPTTLARQDLEQKKLLVRVPNSHFKHWLSENYREVIQASLCELELDQFQVDFVAEEETERKTSRPEGTSRWDAASPESATCRLNSEALRGGRQPCASRSRSVSPSSSSIAA